jgi:hypothetical protein
MISEKYTPTNCVQIIIYRQRIKLMNMEVLQNLDIISNKVNEDNISIFSKVVSSSWKENNLVKFCQFLYYRACQ